MTGQTPGSAGAGIKKVFATSLTETKSYDAEGLGTIRFEGSKVYKWVKYNSGTGPVTIAAGDFVVYVNAAADGYANSEVTGDYTDGDSIGAGVAQAAIADGEYGWVQIKGFATLNTGLAAGSDGQVYTPSGASDKTLKVVDADTEHAAAIAVDQSEDEVVLDCPF